MKAHRDSHSLMKCGAVLVAMRSGLLGRRLWLWPIQDEAKQSPSGRYMAVTSYPVVMRPLPSHRQRLIRVGATLASFLMPVLA